MRNMILSLIFMALFVASNASCQKSMEQEEATAQMADPPTASHGGGPESSSATTELHERLHVAETHAEADLGDQSEAGHGAEAHGISDQETKVKQQSVRAFTVQLTANEDGTLRRAEIEGQYLGSDGDFVAELERQLKDHVDPVDGPKTGAIFKIDPHLHFRYLIKPLQVSSHFVNAQTPADASGFSGKSPGLPIQPHPSFQSALLILGKQAEDRYLVPLMSGAVPAATTVDVFPPLKVRVRRTSQGTQVVMLGDVSLGPHPAAVERLRVELLKLSKQPDGDNQLEVHLDIAPNVSVFVAAEVIRACSMRWDQVAQHYVPLCKLLLSGLYEEEIVEESLDVTLIAPVPALGTLDNRASLQPARRTSQVRLRKIGVAMHQFERTFGHFPPAAACDVEGNPLLSWRVHLLPFLGEFELYRQFHLDEPWDSEHNRKLLSKIPAVYQQPGSALTTVQNNKTSVMVFVGDGAPFGGEKAKKWQHPLRILTEDPHASDGKDNENAKAESETAAERAGQRPQSAGGPRLADIRDGFANTILCVQSGRQVPWTRPQDIPFDPDLPVLSLGKLPERGFMVLLFEGSTHWLSTDIPREKLNALITPNGGEVVNQD